MALTPDKLKTILMTSVMAYFDQMQKDVEVRIATVLKLQDTGLSEPAMIIIAQECSRTMVEFLRIAVVESRELERVADKLL